MIHNILPERQHDVRLVQGLFILEVQTSRQRGGSGLGHEAL